jgi:hypothetical protein
MAKTNTELIREVSKEVAIHGESIRNLSENVTDIWKAINDIRIQVSELDKRIALIEQS